MVARCGFYKTVQKLCLVREENCLRLMDLSIKYI